jgi:hypothetical protein
VNVFGEDPRTGFAHRSLDNVGVQYGLLAFNAGRIDAEEFLDLNARVGGNDIDGNIVAARSVADRKALRIAYETGRVDAIRSHSFRARLIATNGNADTHVNLVASNVGTGAGALSAVEVMSIRLVDQWVENVVNDTSDHAAAAKVVRNKPAGLVDACFTVTGERITDRASRTRLEHAASRRCGWHGLSLVGLCPPAPASQYPTTAEKQEDERGEESLGPR